MRDGAAVMASIRSLDRPVEKSSFSVKALPGEYSLARMPLPLMARPDADGKPARMWLSVAHKTRRCDPALALVEALDHLFESFADRARTKGDDLTADDLPADDITTDDTTVGAASDGGST